MDKVKVKFIGNLEGYVTGVGNFKFGDVKKVEKKVYELELKEDPRWELVKNVLVETKKEEIKGVEK